MKTDLLTKGWDHAQEKIQACINNKKIPVCPSDEQLIAYFNNPKNIFMKSFKTAEEQQLARNKYLAKYHEAFAAYNKSDITSGPFDDVQEKKRSASTAVVGVFKYRKTQEEIGYQPT